MVCLHADHEENYANDFVNAKAMQERNVCWWGKSRAVTLR